MDSRKIIIFSIALFIIASSYLFFVDSRDNSLDFQKDWWVVYFETPRGTALDFVIENHSDKNDFHWEVSDGKNKINEGNVEIAKGALKNIPIAAEDIENKKTTIVVSDGAEEKEIYKFTALELEF